MNSYNRTTVFHRAVTSTHQPIKPMRLPAPLLVLALGLTLGGCASVNHKTTENTPSSDIAASTPITPPYTGGGYYKDDGPGANPPANLKDIPDAVPKQEPLHRYANDPYNVLGRRYAPIASNSAYKTRGLASWYGRKFHGKTTATGEIYDMYSMSAAHATLPLPSYARVTNLVNGKSVVVRVNDRGPFHAGRIIDLSYTAAYKLDILKGVTQVEVTSISPEDAPLSLADATSSPAEAVKVTETPKITALPAPLAPIASTVPSPGIYLQLGAFGNAASADNLIARANTNPSKDLPKLSRIENEGLHKVQAGPFARVEAADLAAQSIQQNLGIKAFKIHTVSTAPASGLYLQFAAVSSRDAADALINRVKNRFGTELPKLDHVNTNNLFKVQAGPFSNPEAADKIALAYQQDFGNKPYRFNR